MRWWWWGWMRGGNRARQLGHTRRKEHARERLRTHKQPARACGAMRCGTGASSSTAQDARCLSMPMRVWRHGHVRLPAVPHPDLGHGKARLPQPLHHTQPPHKPFLPRSLCLRFPTGSAGNHHPHPTPPPPPRQHTLHTHTNTHTRTNTRAPTPPHGLLTPAVGGQGAQGVVEAAQGGDGGALVQLGLAGGGRGGRGEGGDKG